MSKQTNRLLAGAMVAVIIAALWLKLRPQHDLPPPVVISHTEEADDEAIPPPTPLPGDEILADYGSKNHTPRDDIRMIQHTISNFRLLNHHIDARWFATNEDLAEILLGKKGLSHPFISNSSHVTSPDGKIIDRWGAPLFFHLQSSDRLEIRSAGPDGTMFTEDDISTP